MLFSFPEDLLEMIILIRRVFSLYFINVNFKSEL